MTNDRTIVEGEQQQTVALVIREGLAMPETLQLEHGGTFVLGRGTRTEVGETDQEGKVSVGLANPYVSTRHAEITFSNDTYMISDLGSRNGTFVNGEQVTGEQRELKAGDQVELGKGRIALTFRTAAADAGATYVDSVPAAASAPGLPASSPPPQPLQQPEQRRRQQSMLRTVLPFAPDQPEGRQASQASLILGGIALVVVLLVGLFVGLVAIGGLIAGIIGVVKGDKALGTTGVVLNIVVIAIFIFAVSTEASTSGGYY